MHMFYHKSELNFKNLENQHVGISFGTAEEYVFVHHSSHEHFTFSFLLRHLQQN